MVLKPGRGSLTPVNPLKAKRRFEAAARPDTGATEHAEDVPNATAWPRATEIESPEVPKAQPDNQVWSRRENPSVPTKGSVICKYERGKKSGFHDMFVLYVLPRACRNVFEDGSLPSASQPVKASKLTERFKELCAAVTIATWRPELYPPAQISKEAFWMESANGKVKCPDASQPHLLGHVVDYVDHRMIIDPSSKHCSM